VARPRRFWFWRLALAALVLFAVVVLTRSWWLQGFSYALVRNDGPQKADVAVVLAGDPWGIRILTAGKLVRQGYVPVAMVSGPEGSYGIRECDAAIAFAVRHGYPPEYFIPVSHEARSTQEEAWVFVQELQRRHMHRMLLVTSNYHTRRALRTFEEVGRKLKAGIEMHVIAAPDREFHPDSWWQTRQGQKIMFMEWTKTLAAAAGL